jgi:ribonuclease P protein subunit RPR2
MAKAKTSKGASSVPNKAVHSRVSYLFQAAAYLATKQQHSTTAAGGSQPPVGQYTVKPPTNSPLQPASRHLISDLRSVSLKVMIRISPTMKHSICKNCDTMLIDRFTCTKHVENRSKGGKKPWADVLVLTCNTCGSEKRFPTGAERQKRRPCRTTKEKMPRKDERMAMEVG